MACAARGENSPFLDNITGLMPLRANRPRIMEHLFDPALVAQRRRRAAHNFDPRSGFLLDIAAEEIAFRLMAVERRFENVIELFGGTGAVARAALATGKIGTMTRV